MKNNSYAEEIAATRLMLSGLKNHQKLLSKRGIDDEYLTGLEADYNDMLRLDNEQESAKARQKESTAALEKTLEKVQKKRSEARKIVKMTIPQAGWIEFGIEDKR